MDWCVVKAIKGSEFYDPDVEKGQTMYDFFDKLGKEESRNFVDKIFSRHKDGKYSELAIENGWPDDTQATTEGNTVTVNADGENESEFSDPFHGMSPEDIVKAWSLMEACDKDKTKVAKTMKEWDDSCFDSYEALICEMDPKEAFDQVELNRKKEGSESGKDTTEDTGKKKTASKSKKLSKTKYNSFTSPQKVLYDAWKADKPRNDDEVAIYDFIVNNNMEDVIANKDLFFQFLGESDAALSLEECFKCFIDALQQANS